MTKIYILPDNERSFSNEKKRLFSPSELGLEVTGLLKNKSIRTKMIWIFTPLVLVSTLLMAFLAYWLFSMRMESILMNNVSETVQQVNRHADTYMEEFVRLTVLPYYSSVMDVLNSRLPLTHDQYETVQKVVSGAVTNQREDLEGVFIYRHDGERFSATVYNA